MAELGQGKAPDTGKVGDKARCLVSRNGISSSDLAGAPLAIEVGSGGGGGTSTTTSSSKQFQAKRTSAAAGDYDSDSQVSPSSINSNSPSVVAPMLQAVGVMEETVNGKRVIDFTRLSTTRANRAKYQQLQEEQQHLQQLIDLASVDTSSPSHAASGADYSAHYDPAMMAAYHHYYASYAGYPPMWPGATAYPGWPPVASAGDAAAPPPPPPPPPPSS
jgi:hypothetical protein